ncbi:hypothetical protein A8H39_01855 [Paraburkholderia fungorum]|uniref:hypothetical protein n=1 Tax=Paraburkholderia fungorum TaxID=134537 RepID=UPI00047F868D|nr:hypothetical protein [Paraburkholderia fungorum]PNE59916.1 hypothetical protein A8H39_01855 [Paraburkholderia fungorum]
MLTRQQKMYGIFLIVAVGAMGWLCTAGLAMYAAKMRISEALAERDAANWKRQAGKAYTQLIAARAGHADGKFLLPAGSRIEGTMTTKEVNGRAVASLNVSGTVFYPPKDY